MDMRVKGGSLQRMLKGSMHKDGPQRLSPAENVLSGRESEVFSGIAFGLTNREIANWLGISSRTVEIHRMHAIQKLGARNTADAVRIAIGTGFQFQIVPDP